MTELEQAGFNKRVSYHTILVCKRNNIYNFKGIHNHYVTYKRFTNLKHCGPKTNEALLKIVKNYSPNMHLDATRKGEKHIYMSSFLSLA